MTAVDDDLGDLSVWAKASPAMLSKLVAAATELEEIEKDKRNNFHNYEYSSIEAVARATRDPLLSRGILIVPEVSVTKDRPRSTREGESVVTTAELVFTIFDAETGERLVVPWAGRGDDPADKGLSKAITDARKTFLIALFNVPRGDDTEADEATDQRGSGAGTPNTVNLTGLVQGSGLTNTVLNQILVAANLPAADKPFGAFGRIPKDVADNVRANLEAAKRA